MSQMEAKAVEQTIQTYFECMFESDPDKAIEAFHPSAKICGFMQDGLAEMTIEQFAKVVAAVSPSAKESGAVPFLEIVSLNISGNTAVARVRDAYQGLMFLDTLSLIKVDDRWLIYNKLFHVEGEV